MRDKGVRVRLTAAEWERLLSLADATGRSRSQVVRLLLAQARLGEQVPDVRLEEERQPAPEVGRHE